MKTVQLDIATLNVLAGVIVPLLTGFLTKMSATSAVKAWMNAVLSAVAGGVAVAVAAQGSVDLRTWVMSIGITFVTSISTYYGLWKPTTVAPTVQEKTAGFGVG